MGATPPVHRSRPGVMAGTEQPCNLSELHAETQLTIPHHLALQAMPSAAPALQRPTRPRRNRAAHAEQPAPSPPTGGGEEPQSLPSSPAECITAAPLSKAPRTSSDRTCLNCGAYLRLYYNRTQGRWYGRCRPCDNADKRRDRVVASLTRLRSAVARLRRRSLDATALLDRVDALLRSYPAETLAAALGPEKTADLGLWIARRAYEERDRLAAQIAEEEAAAVSLESPDLRAEMLTMAIEEAGRNPERVASALARSSPQALAEALVAVGWTVTPPYHCT